jgi:hypothetical protein
MKQNSCKQSQKRSNYMFITVYLVLITVSHNIAGIGAVWFKGGKMGPGRTRMLHNMSKDAVSERKQVPKSDRRS